MHPLQTDQIEPHFPHFVKSIAVKPPFAMSSNQGEKGTYIRVFWKIVRTLFCQIKDYCTTHIAVVLLLSLCLCVSVSKYESATAEKQEPSKGPHGSPWISHYRIKRAQDLYTKEMEKFLEIDMVMDRYLQSCKEAIFNHSWRTARVRFRIAQVHRVLDEIMNASGLSPAKAKVASLRLDYLLKTLQQRHKYWRIMNKQLVKVVLLKYEWYLDANLIKAYAANDGFVWKDVLEKEGLCPVDDPDKPLCNVLQKIDTVFDKRWKQITNKKEL